jgi:hypothetical protein
LATGTVAWAQTSNAPESVAQATAKGTESITVQAPYPSGAGVSPNGATEYSVTAADILQMPLGVSTNITDVLAQMPGVAIDQNQQIHIRNTEGPQFQYQINGVLVPIDINTNPPFVSMINPDFVQKLDLLDGILPSRYSYATGGVVDITTKDGCEHPGGTLNFLGGQRGTIQTSADYSGCAGDISYFVSGQVGADNTAFSSATPGPEPIHDNAHEGQFFSVFTDKLDQTTKLTFIGSAAGSDNELPNVPGLAPAFDLAGVKSLNSENINSFLNFRDYLGILALNGSPAAGMTYQLAYTVHSIAQNFKPDNAGELVFQGVSSTASDHDFDNTIEGDFTYDLGRHSLSTGFYLGDYRVDNSDSSLVFPLIDPITGQPSPNGNPATTPINIGNTTRETNIIGGLYLNDLWHITDQLSANIGLRWDAITGFTRNNQFDPTINFVYEFSDNLTAHAGYARNMQVPSFRGIPATATVNFNDTTAASPPGVSSPLTEDDNQWDIGVVYHPNSHITLSNDNFFELTRHYLDTGQFGVVPIFAPFNYEYGYIWGTQFSASYREGDFTGYANLTIGKNVEKGVATGQFNFDPDELAFIDAHHIILDHQPLVGLTGGVTYNLNPWSFGAELTYSSGLVGGFADQETLPAIVQVNLNAERKFEIPGIGTVVDRVIIENALDKVNEIRPAEGIGIFQSAFEPRFTVLDSLSIPF